MINFVPPQQLAYSSLEETRAAIDDHVQPGGYVVNIKHTRRVSKKKNGDVKAKNLVCSQSNPPFIPPVLDFAIVCHPAGALVFCLRPVYGKEKLEIERYKLPI